MGEPDQADYTDFAKATSKRLANHGIKNATVFFDQRLQKFVAEVAFESRLKLDGLSNDKAVKRLKAKSSELENAVLDLLTGDTEIRWHILADRSDTQLVNLAMAESGREVRQEGDTIGQWLTISNPASSEYFPHIEHLVKVSSTGEVVDLRAPEFDRIRLDDWKKDLWKAVCKKYDTSEFRVLAKSDSRIGTEHFEFVRSTVGTNGSPALEFGMTKKGARKLLQLTRKNINRSLAMAIGGEILLAPNINSPIAAKGIIEGDFDLNQINDIGAILLSGKFFKIRGVKTSEYISPVSETDE